MTADTLLAALTQGDIARLLNVSKKTVSRLVTSNSIPGELALGIRTPRYDRATVEAWIAAGCPKQTAE